MYTALLSLYWATGLGAFTAAPDKVYTEQGVEIRHDERVFDFFVVLNGLGFSRETKEQGPPLSAPVFHPVRQQVRASLAESKQRAEYLDRFRTYFQKNPDSIENYLSAILTEDGKAPAVKPKDFQALLKQYESESLQESLYAATAEAHHTLLLEFRKELERDLNQATKQLGVPLVAAEALTVVPAPLDAQGASHRIQQGHNQFVIVGTENRTARKAALSAALVATIEKAARGQLHASYRQHWNENLSAAIKRDFGTPDRYFAENLAHAIACRITAQKTEDVMDTCVDEGIAERLQWTRSAMFIAGQANLAKTLGELSRRYHP